MINVSDQLLKESKENQDYYVTANVTLADGTNLPLKKEDFYLDGNGIVDSADSSSFPIGVAIEKTATLSLVNDEGQFSGYSFNRAVFAIYMNLELSDGKVETFKRGSFIVCKKPAVDEEINLTLLDYMSKTDKSYESNLIFPCTVGEVLRDCCQACGIALGDAVFTNDDFRVIQKPTSTTYRAVIGMVAALAGGNARIDENDLLRIVTYQAAPKVVELVETPWLDTQGNSICDTEGNQIIMIREDATIGLDLSEGIDDVQTDTDIITVTGVKYTEDKQDYVYGTEGYMINLKENQLLAGNAEDGVNRIGQILVGFQILPFSLRSVPIGYATFGDAVQFEDYRGNVYRSYATDIEFLFADSTNFSCKAKSVESQESEYPDENKVLVEQVKEDARQRMTAYDIKLKQMNELAANTLGFYYTDEEQDDGSVISYRHDKPTLEESQVIYKNGIDGFFLSTDGGETWKAGFDSNGDAVFNILYAIGIQAEWINTRGLKAQDNDGNTTFEVNADTGEVSINSNRFYLGDTSLADKLKGMDNNIAAAKNMTLQLSNEYQAISVDSDGNYSTFPSGITTKPTVMYGSKDITADCTYMVTKSEGVTGVWNNASKTFTVTGLTVDNGWVEIQAVYLQVLAVTKRFVLTKLYAGPQGNKGLDGLQGPKGDQGIPGPKGESGKPSYTWMKYASMPNGEDMSDNPDTVPWIDTDGNTICDTVGNPIYLEPEYVAYIGIANNKETPTESDDPADYTWTRYKGADGENGSDGKDGADGKDGKTSYTHIAYANSADGKTDFSVSDSNREYIGMYADFTEQDSTNPDDYAWTLVKGANGAQGIPGKAGVDGKTPYFHIAYANSADGKTGFDVVVSAGKQYIGQYTDYDTPDDSIDPTKYRWTKIKGEQGEKGEQGVPGRTYFIELSSNILKRGQNDKVVPSTITAKAYYRDGDSAARTAYSGRWYVQTSTDGSTFTNALVSTVNEPSKSYTVSSLDRSIVSVRFILYAADGTTNQLDMQSVPVVIDVDALTHEEIFNLLTNNGFIKGVYKEGNQLYFSFTYAKGGTLKLGGPNNGYGTFEVYDANGNIITQIDNSVGFKNFKGKEWFQINESVATAGYDSSLVHGLLDLSAQYSDGYWTVLESKQAGLLLKTVSRMKVETTGSSSLTLNVPEMPKLITGSNLGKNSNGDVGTIASSSMRYKILWKAVKEDELEELYRIKVIWAKYKDGYLMEQDERCGKEMPMFIAEDIERRFPIAVDHDEKGRAENWNYRIMIPCMFAMLKNEHEKVKDLQSELDSVKAELEELKQLIEQHISTEV